MEVKHIKTCLDVLLKILIFVMVAGTVHFAIQIMKNNLNKELELPPITLDGYTDILEDNPNEVYFKYMFTIDETTYPNPTKSKTNTVVITHVTFSTDTMTAIERKMASDYYLKNEIKKAPSIVIINFSDQNQDFYGQTLYVIKDDVPLDQIEGIDDYHYQYFMSEIPKKQDEYPSYERKKSAFNERFKEIEVVNDSPHYLADEALSELNYNITNTLERPIYFRQLEGLTMMQESNEEQGVLMAGIDLLVWNEYNRGLSHQFVEVTDDMQFTIYKDKNEYVFGLKSERPFYLKKFYYKIEVPTYHMNYSLQLDAYFIEFGRVFEGAQALSHFSPYFNISHNIDHQQIEVINDANDLVINKNKIWRKGETIAIRQLESLFDLEYSYVMNESPKG